MRSPRVIAAVLLVLTLGACTGDKDDPDPDAALKQARARLSVLARATANGSYDASYRFVQLPSNATGSIRIRQTPPQYRIDIVARNGASYFSLKSGIVSCSRKGTKRTCLLVARPGEEAPELFDPGVQRLFRDAVEDLAARPDDYTVVTTTPPTVPPATGSPSPTPSTLPIPPGECFAVTRVSTVPDPDPEKGFEPGTYCFAEQGVATAISVKSGALTLVKLLGPPPAAAYTPPAKVQRLPDLTPTPTP